MGMRAEKPSNYSENADWSFTSSHSWAISTVAKQSGTEFVHRHCPPEKRGAKKKKSHALQPIRRRFHRLHGIVGNPGNSLSGRPERVALPRREPLAFSFFFS
jgi:hypothetical protein